MVRALHKGSGGEWVRRRRFRSIGFRQTVLQLADQSLLMRELLLDLSSLTHGVDDG